MAQILVVAREWTPRVLIRAQLEEEGHEVTGCLTASEALLRLRARQHQFDAIILDTMGQELTSPAISRLVKAGPPVLVVTGPYDSAAIDLTSLGARHALTRPVFVGDVVAAVRQLLVCDGGPSNRASGQ